MDNTTLKAIGEHIGHRIREARLLRGASPSKIAAAIRVDSQKFKKYEKEGERISAARLCQIAYFLDIPPSFFFEGISSKRTKLDSPLNKEQTTLLRYYEAVPRESRPEVLKLLQIMGEKDK